MFPMNIYETNYVSHDKAHLLLYCRYDRFTAMLTTVKAILSSERVVRAVDTGEKLTDSSQTKICLGIDLTN